MPLLHASEKKELSNVSHTCDCSIMILESQKGDFELEHFRCRYGHVNH